MEKLIDVLSAVVVRDGKFLICKRPTHKRHGGLWEFPGGKLEEDEDWLAAAKRELSEELDVNVVDVGDPLLAIHDEGSQFNIVFVITTIVGDPTPLEHEEIAWVSVDDLTKYNLAPSDRRFATWLVGQPVV